MAFLSGTAGRQDKKNCPERVHDLEDHVRACRREGEPLWLRLAHDQDQVGGKLGPSGPEMRGSPLV